MNLYYNQGVNAYVTFVFVHTELSYKQMFRTVASNRNKLSKWDHEGRGGRILYGDRYGGWVNGDRNWRSKQALEFWRLQLFVKIIRKKDNGGYNDWYDLNRQCCLFLNQM